MVLLSFQTRSVNFHNYSGPWVLYLPCRLLGDRNLSLKPTVSLVTRLGPDWTSKHTAWPSIHIECAHSGAIHVVPKADTGASGAWIIRTDQSSLLSWSSGTGGLSVKVMSYGKSKINYVSLFQDCRYEIFFKIIKFTQKFKWNLFTTLEYTLKIYFYWNCMKIRVFLKSPSIHQV